MTTTPYKTWLCIVCGLVYDEAQGWPEDGIAPGTRWEDVPEDWVCPECQVGKADFEMLDISEVIAVAASPAPLQAVPKAAAPVVALTPPTAKPLAAAIAQHIAEPIVIIGSGHAGYGLAQALRKADSRVEIHVLTAESGHQYYKPGLSIGLSHDKSPEAMRDKSPFAIEQEWDIRIHPYCKVLRIDPAAQRLHTRLGEMDYGQLVLACGAAPIRLPLQGDTSGVVSINTLDDYRIFRERLTGARKVAIIGDGLIGCEFANDLAASGFDVSVIGLAHWPMERLLPAQAGHYLQTALETLGVHWYLQNTVQRIDRHGGGWHLHLADRSTLDADLILSAVGLQPDLALAESAGLQRARGICVDDDLQTSQPGIYALGDCIEINGRLLPYLAPINHGIKALANTLLGQPTAVDYPLMPISVKTPAAPLCLVPPPPNLDGQWQMTPATDGLTAGFYDHHDTLHGFVLMGRPQQAQRQQWIQACQREHKAVA